MRLSELPAAALLVVFMVVTVVIGQLILGDMKGSITTATGNTSADDGIDALSNLTDWSDIITLVIAAAVIIGILGLMRLGGGGL